MERSFIEELQLLIQSYHKYSAEEFNSMAHDTLLRAYALIESLEGAVEEKNNLIKKYSNAEEAFLQRVKKAIESERAAYERLADIDISRHVEVADLKQEIDKLKTEKGVPESKELDSLKREMEIKKLQLQESEKNLVALAETLKEFRSEHERLRAECSLPGNKANEADQLRERLKAIENENLSLRNELSGVKELLKQREEEIAARPLPDHNEKIANLNDECTIREKDIADLKEKIDRLISDKDELVFNYSEEIAKLNDTCTIKEKDIADLKEKIDRLVSDKDELVFNLSGSAKETALIKGENEQLTKKISDLTSEIKKLSEEKEKETSRRLKVEREINTITAVIEEKKKIIASRDEEIEKIRDIYNTEIQKYTSDIDGVMSEAELSKQKLSGLQIQVEKELSAHSSALKELSEEKESLAAKLKEAREESSRTRDENSTLKKDLANTINQLSEIKSHAQHIEKDLSEEKDQLSRKLKKSEEEATSLTSVNNRLQKNLSDTISELSEIRSREKERGETVPAQEILQDTSGKLSEILKRLEDSIINNQSLAEKLEQISVQRVELQYPMVIEKKEVLETKKNTRLKPLAAILIIILMLSAGMLAAYKFKGRLLNAWSSILESAAAMVTQRPQKPTVPTGPWSGTREVATENFNAAVTLLDSEMMTNHEIPSRITEEEKLKNNFYMLEINAKNGCIPADFINEPNKKISILNKDGAELDINKIKNLDLLKKAFYKNNACDGDTGAVFLRYFIAINKDQSLKGIMIDGLVENEPITIK